MSLKPPCGLYEEQFEKDGCGIGLIARPDGLAKRDIVANALNILRRLEHRGAVGADAKTSDGAGILTAIPKGFFRKLPEMATHLSDDDFAVGMIFSPPEQNPAVLVSEFQNLANEFGLTLLTTRPVPVDSKQLGAQAQGLEPAVTQVFLASSLNEQNLRDASLVHFRRKLDQARSRHNLYVCSLSFDTIVYKGMLAPGDLAAYFLDLGQDSFTSAFAMVHSRFSTNTLPAWELAHPFRSICHNGEINTLRGNLAWMQAREKFLPTFAPLIPPGLSDSSSLDHALELLVATGRSVAEALMILIPQAWENDPALPIEIREFYRFHASRMEPWDGPAAVCFADRNEVGATLDRSGFRPCHYWILDDDTLVLSSEVGVLEVDPVRVISRGRLGPGQMIAVSFKEKRILFNDELKRKISRRADYQALTAREEIALEAKPLLSQATWSRRELCEALAHFAVSDEEIRMTLQPMFTTGEEATSSMGNDTPLAILSVRPQLLFKYFRQLFAQVTNPPIDPIREGLVMSLGTSIGVRANLFAEKPELHRRLPLEQPVLDQATFEAIQTHFKTSTLNLEFIGSANDLEPALQQLCRKALDSVTAGTEVLILSDQERSTTGDQFAAIPALLACGAIHHALIRAGLRTSASILIASGEPRDVHHFSCLIGYGADAVYPYLMFALINALELEKEAPLRYVAAISKGLLSVMSKMGITCLRSYCGAQVFEAIGLAKPVIDLCFTGTPSRVEGLGLREIGEESLRRAAQARTALAENPLALGLRSSGEIHFRKDGEDHIWNPTTIAQLQIATRLSDAKTFREFSIASNQSSRGSLRGHLRFKTTLPQSELRLDAVEPVSAIVKRFTTGAMSFGSLGQEAHETLAIAMNRMGGKSNSGEGGESDERFRTLANGDQKISKIKQVASGRFGVTANYLVNASELQIKIAQGAKPGEGGKLPGYKVDAVIARLRHSTPGVTLISPPPHHDIYSIEDLAQLIFDLRRANPQAQISVKLVAAAGIGTIAAGVVKAGADKILISGDGGGTGASPLSSIKSAGSPWELGLSEVQQTLVMQGLRSRVRLETDGQMRTGLDVAIAAALGADEFGFSTAPLIVEGCVMMRKCHLNTCPVGVATQDPELRKKFTGQPEHVTNYFFFVANELREILQGLGFTSVSELIGRTDLLEQIASEHWKVRTLDLSRLLVRTTCQIPHEKTIYRYLATPLRPGDDFEDELNAKCASAIEQAKPLTLQLQINNNQRTLGTSLSAVIAQRYGAQGLPSNTLTLECTGCAGQSFGAFLAKGLTLRLTGEANDFVGKGLSGGRIVIQPATQRARESNQVLAGNACVYGATTGEVFIAGAAGERFAVRNSGAIVIVEGIGDHGCEYMTGGTAIILGRFGRNFGAGMSGGQVFVFDEFDDLNSKLGSNELEVRALQLQSGAGNEDLALKKLLERYALETDSVKARRLLSDWEKWRVYFKILIPLEYKRALAAAQVSARESAGKELIYE